MNSTPKMKLHSELFANKIIFSYLYAVLRLCKSLKADIRVGKVSVGLH